MPSTVVKGIAIAVGGAIFGLAVVRALGFAYHRQLENPIQMPFEDRPPHVIVLPPRQNTKRPQHATKHFVVPDVRGPEPNPQENREIQAAPIETSVAAQSAGDQFVQHVDAPPPPAPVVVPDNSLADIQAALDRYSHAWSTRKPELITALRPALPEATVRQELDGVRSIEMTIRPVGTPRVDGDRATVECVQETRENFGDAEKVTPERTMTYELVRAGDGWRITN